MRFGPQLGTRSPGRSPRYRNRDSETSTIHSVRKVRRRYIAGFAAWRSRGHNHGPFRDHDGRRFESAPVGGALGSAGADDSRIVSGLPVDRIGAGGRVQRKQPVTDRRFGRYLKRQAGRPFPPWILGTAPAARPFATETGVGEEAERVCHATLPALASFIRRENHHRPQAGLSAEFDAGRGVRVRGRGVEPVDSGRRAQADAERSFARREQALTYAVDNPTIVVDDLVGYKRLHH